MSAFSVGHVYLPQQLHCCLLPCQVSGHVKFATARLSAGLSETSQQGGPVSTLQYGDSPLGGAQCSACISLCIVEAFFGFADQLCGQDC